MKRARLLMLWGLLAAAACGGGGSGGGSSGDADSTPPSTPSGFTVSATSNGTVDMLWGAADGVDDGGGYRIYRDGIESATTDNLSYKDQGLEGGATYCYMLAAYDASGNESAPTAETCVTTPSTATAVGWERTYGGPEYDEGRSIISTTDGGYVIAGFSDTGGVAVGDVFLLKIDSSGSVLWQSTIGDISYNDEGWDVRETSDGGFVVVGETRVNGLDYDVYVVRTDASGALLWSGNYGGADNDYGYEIRQTPDGGFVVAGVTYSYGAGNRDAYLLKVDSQGTLLWERTFGGADNDYAYAVAVASDGGLIVAGGTASSGLGETDLYLIRTDSSGNALWERTFGGDEDDIAYSVIETSDGGIVLAGYSFSYGNGYNDAYVVKADPSGNLIWHQAYGGENEEYVEDIRQTDDGGYVFTGYTGSIGSGWSDLYVVRLDYAGRMYWENSYGGSGEEYGNSIVQTSGGFIAVGYSNSWDPGASDVYAVRFDDFGNLFVQ